MLGSESPSHKMHNVFRLISQSNNCVFCSLIRLLPLHDEGSEHRTVPQSSHFNWVLRYRIILDFWRPFWLDRHPTVWKCVLPALKGDMEMGRTSAHLSSHLASAASEQSLSVCSTRRPVHIGYLCTHGGRDWRLVESSGSCPAVSNFQFCPFPIRLSSFHAFG